MHAIRRKISTPGLGQSVFSKSLAHCAFVFMLACASVAAQAKTRSKEAQIEYVVIVDGVCKFQMFKGWFDCNNKGTYTLFNNGRYLYQFSDGRENVYMFSGASDNQPDIRNLYSKIDEISAVINGQKVVDRGAMGECHMNVSPAGDKVYYIDCDVFNQRKSVFFQFRMHDIVKFDRACGNELKSCD